MTKIGLVYKSSTENRLAGCLAFMSLVNTRRIWTWELECNLNWYKYICFSLLKLFVFICNIILVHQNIGLKVKVRCFFLALHKTPWLDESGAWLFYFRIVQNNGQVHRRMSLCAHVGISILLDREFGTNFTRTEVFSQILTNKFVQITTYLLNTHLEFFLWI